MKAVIRSPVNVSDVDGVERKRKVLEHRIRRGRVQNALQARLVEIHLQELDIF